MNSNHWINSAKNAQASIACLLILVLSGCISQPLRQTDNSGMQLSESQHWFVKGRVAIQTEDDNVSATLEWQKAADNFDFHIYGMFGATYTHLIQDGDKATLKLPEDQIFYHRNAELLMYEHLGWDFPIDALSYWIKGLASGKAGEQVTRDDNGQIKNIVFRDWKIDFSRYQSFSGYQLPKMLKARHPQMSLKIAVKKWNFGPVE